MHTCSLAMSKHRLFHDATYKNVIKFYISVIGSGIATWQCQATPVVCWKGEPDVKSCTSEAIQDLTNKVYDM